MHEHKVIRCLFSLQWKQQNCSKNFSWYSHNDRNTPEGPSDPTVTKFGWGKISSTVHFSYKNYVSRSLIIKISWRLRWRVVTTKKHFRSQPAENCPSVSDVVLITDGRLFHVAGQATEKLREPKTAVLIRRTTRSSWPAERKWWRVETVETGLIIDMRYGATSWWRHLYTRIQILKSIRCRTRSQ